MCIVRMIRNHEKEDKVVLDRRVLSVYSLYLILGSIGLFVSVNNIYTLIQAFIWQYSEKYIAYTSSIIVFSFISGLLLLSASRRLIYNDRRGYIIGLIGCLILVLYNSYILILDVLMPYTFMYLLLLYIPGLVLCILSLLWWMRRVKTC